MHLVIGLGKTGHSIARFLTHKKTPFILFDTRQQPPELEAFKQEFPQVKMYHGTFPPNLLDSISTIISSPGVSLDEPFMQEAHSKGIPIIGDIECLAREITAPVIAITGTNGKSTVTTLVGEMAKTAGLTVAVAGNIGLPVLDILGVGVHYDLWVLELSSFQLDLTYSLAPTAATILNITPDHLDRHHNMEAYIKAKQRIYQQAKTILVNREDSNTYPPSSKAHSLMSFGIGEPEANDWGLTQHDGQTYLAKGADAFLPVNELHIKGRHNWLNALAACALAETIGISKSHMIDVLKRFAGLPHRSQWVRSLHGVDWINDSKGTNIGATVSAIAGIGESIKGKIVLIAGGQGKGANFKELVPALTFVRSVVLIGADADKIEAAIKDNVTVIRAPTLNIAVKFAKEAAKPDDVVLLSPACASFDMFRDFNHRGDDFIAIVNSL